MSKICDRCRIKIIKPKETIQCCDCNDVYCSIKCASSMATPDIDLNTGICHICEED
jgi:hypothetical protein